MDMGYKNIDKKLDISDYISAKFTFDSIDYNVFYKRNVVSDFNAPRILVVSYQPNYQASQITKMAIETIRKFTDSDYELWVIDNCSPQKNISWMQEYKDINLVLIRTEPKEKGSYANGLALEVASKLIDRESKYVVTFHLDVAVTRYGWLKFMLSKLDENVRASGFRLNKERVKEGVLHVCGYLIDFQLFKRLNLSFMPELPSFDIGDKVIYEFLRNGYKIYPIKNTFDDESLIKIIPDTMKAKNLNVTRAFNDENDIVYMHLGRGILKSQGKYDNPKRTNASQWVDYINTFLLSNIVYQKINPAEIESLLLSSDFDYLNFTASDFLNYHFFKDKIQGLSSGAKVLLIKEENSPAFGKNSESVFSNNIRKFNVISKNDFVISETGKEEFDCIVLNNCKGLLTEKISEIFKKLKRGGIFLGIFPKIEKVNNNKNKNENEDFYSFLNKISENFWKAGFKEVSIEKQGNQRFIDLEDKLSRLRERYKNQIGSKDEKKYRDIEKIFLEREIKRTLIYYDRDITVKDVLKDNSSLRFGIFAVK